jgi:hypothetical protein
MARMAALRPPSHRYASERSCSQAGITVQSFGGVNLESTESPLLLFPVYAQSSHALFATRFEVEVHSLRSCMKPRLHSQS